MGSMKFVYLRPEGESQLLDGFAILAKQWVAENEVILKYFFNPFFCEYIVDSLILCENSTPCSSWASEIAHSVNWALSIRVV